MNEAGIFRAIVTDVREINGVTKVSFNAEGSNYVRFAQTRNCMLQTGTEMKTQIKDIATETIVKVYSVVCKACPAFSVCGLAEKIEDKRRS